MILLKNVTLYDPRPLGKKDVLLSYDKVALVEDHIDCPLPGTEVIDGSELIAVPGFMDQHVHPIGGGGEQGLHSRTPELQLSNVVEADVTTLVGVLGTDCITRSVDALLAKTKALNNEGVTAFCLTSAYCYPPVTLTGSVMRDIVMLQEVLGCKLALSDNRGSHPTREELIRLVSDIRMAGLVGGKPGVLHIHMGVDKAGIEPLLDIVRTTDIPIWHFRPTHMAKHPDQAVTFTQMGGYADFTAGVNLPKVLSRVWPELNKSLTTISSDSNGSMPKWDATHEHVIGMGVGKMTSLFNTVRELVRMGIPLEDILPCITKNVAEALLLYPRKGTVQAGSDADLVLLREDLTIDTVIARGRKLMEGQRVLVKGMYE